MQAHHIEAVAIVDFDPVTYQQMAGLVADYNTNHFHYLHVYSNDDSSRKLLGIISVDKTVPTELDEPIDVTGVEQVSLKMDFTVADLQFYYAVEEGCWQPIGPVLGGSILSDDYVEDGTVRYRPCFTGAFVGHCCQDLSGRGLHADFDCFEYREVD